MSQQLNEHSLSITSYSAGKHPATHHPPIQPPKLTCLWTHITNILNYVIYSFKLPRTNINIVHRQNFAHFWFVQRWENWREWMRPHGCRGDLRRWDTDWAAWLADTSRPRATVVSWLSADHVWSAGSCVYHLSSPPAATHSWPDGPKSELRKIFCNLNIRTSQLYCSCLSIFV